jgi:hypothetical protein
MPPSALVNMPPTVTRDRPGRPPDPARDATRPPAYYPKPASASARLSRETGHAVRPAIRNLARRRSRVRACGPRCPSRGPSVPAVPGACLAVPSVPAPSARRPSRPRSPFPAHPGLIRPISPACTRQRPPSAPAVRHETPLSARSGAMKSGVHAVPAGPERPGCGAGGAGVTEVRFPLATVPGREHQAKPSRRSTGAQRIHAAAQRLHPAAQRTRPARLRPPCP